MSILEFQPVRPVGSETALLDWQRIHNLIIPTDPLSVDEIAVRAQRNILEVAYAGTVPVGCSTVRPPEFDSAPGTVIARVLPEHRRHGYGEQIYERGLAAVRELGAHVVQTVILASNDDGLRFARRHGFVEIERYVLPGDTVAFVDLQLA
ncbi:GNAT family N-acetyltransferase [Micromonospora arida]|uniref:GNAT family N-acetyltransferase n=1 Tax=Micromonospora arida TaxID=2203715 RepID=UPI0033A0A977